MILNKTKGKDKEIFPYLLTQIFGRHFNAAAAQLLVEKFLFVENFV